MTARRKYVDKPTKMQRIALMKHAEKTSDIDKSAWVRPERPPVVITLPDVRLVSITDEMVGLVPHEGAQLRAEDYLRIAAAARLRAELAAEAQAAKDAALDAIEDGRLSSDDAAILAELRRLEQMPIPRWMRPEGESAA